VGNPSRKARMVEGKMVQIQPTAVLRLRTGGAIVNPKMREKEKNKNLAIAECENWSV
jgi:hypothetical protein